MGTAMDRTTVAVEEEAMAETAIKTIRMMSNEASCSAASVPVVARTKPRHRLRPALATR